MIGQGEPNKILYQRGDLFALEDLEYGTVVMYTTVETFAQLKPSTERKIADEPYFYDVETSMYYQLHELGTAPATEEGWDKLLEQVPTL